MKVLITICCSVFLISACGGGGGGSTTTPATPDPAPVVVTEQSTTEEPVETLTLSRKNPLETVSGSDVVTSNAGSSNEIVVPNGFNLETEQYFTLNVDHPNVDTKAYLSVCTDFTVNEAQEYDINYDRCVVRTSLEFSTYETDIAVTNDVTTLVAALWYMDTEIDPLYVEWNLEDITD